MVFAAEQPGVCLIWFETPKTALCCNEYLYPSSSCNVALAQGNEPILKILSQSNVNYSNLRVAKFGGRTFDVLLEDYKHYVTLIDRER